MWMTVRIQRHSVALACEKNVDPRVNEFAKPQEAFLQIHCLMNPDLVEKIRADFPILATEMNGKPLVYLDNGATTQKPKAVIDSIVHYYTHDNANIHRGAYELSERATLKYESARRKVAQFLGASDPAECIFVRGTTEGINLVASSWGANLSAGDEVVVTGLEHHSNIVPWQMACDRVGAKLQVWHPSDTGELDTNDLKSLLGERTRLVAFQHVSNALGTIHDAKAIVEMAKSVGACTLIDGAQWVGHHSTDVLDLGCDFYTFSGHKLYGPTGIGVLWGRRELLESMPPYQGGGDMIESVAFAKTTYAPLPNRFEAGTPDIAGAIGLGAAIDYVGSIGFENIAAQEAHLLQYATQALRSVPGLRIIGTANNKAAVVSFTLEEPSIAPLDIATALNNGGIAIRTGHHCCMPLMGQLEVTGTCRVSLAMYNTAAEVDVTVETLKQLVEQRVARQEKDTGIPSTNDVEVSFATAFAGSPNDAADKLAEEFLLFDDRESKTELLMELGQELPNSFETLKAISTAVPGCMSEVYLVGRPVADSAEKCEFAADSNADIVRGLIAVLEKLFSGQSASEILGFNIEAFFLRIGLDQFVSTQRRSGLNGMIGRIRTLAQAVIDRN